MLKLMGDAGAQVRQNAAPLLGRLGAVAARLQDSQPGVAGDQGSSVVIHASN